jgi:uncharacterized membrane protein YfcA
MAHRSTATYVLVMGIVIVVAGIVLIPLVGPGILVFAVGFVVTAIAVVLLLAERSRTKLAAMDPPDPGPPPAG